MRPHFQRAQGRPLRRRFLGSHLYFEDLQERKPSEDRHRLLGRQTENGILCEVLESVRTDPRIRPLLGMRLRKPSQALTAP
ncbi:MAG TPA: outer membrane lipoprotein-sorting protein [Thiobacillus sp.]|nr:outer membrane lipoprotein-sorting protein [Thiobacillus sp.]